MRTAARSCRLFSTVATRKIVVGRIPKEVYSGLQNQVAGVFPDGAGTIIDPRCTALVDFFSRIAAEQSGMVVDPVIARHPMGCGKPQHFEYIFRKLFSAKTDVEIDTLVANSMQQFERRFEKEVATADLVSGLKATLRTLQEMNCKVGVTSSYPTAVLRAALGRHGLTLPFVTPDNVAKGRPAPDMLEMLSVSLGVDLSKCLVVGDTPLDVHAGRNAGAWTAVVTQTSAFAVGEGIKAEKAVLAKLAGESAEPNLVLDDIQSLPDACYFISYLMQNGITPGVEQRFHLDERGVDIHSVASVTLPESNRLRCF